jgi:phosphoribosylformylglycinamidine cyclo-ligase
MMSGKKPATYRDAGVDIEKGDRFVDFIKSIKSKSLPANLGGFAGGIEIDTEKYRRPVLLSTTDGVGTKLLVAMRLRKYDTVGIDLVAMNVNDLIVCGAKPLIFLDYIACGKINEEILQEVMKGIVAGCEQAECILAGGETAEMPELYSADDFDLAGFAVGIVEKEKMLPKTAEINPGDAILGIASSGIHSNGFSLARKVIPETDKKTWELLLVPTKIYIKEMDRLFESGLILGAAHITGSGLEANIGRALPETMKPRLFYDWPVHEIFSIIQKNGRIADEEMRRVFNLGIGMALVTKKENAALLIRFGKEHNINLMHIGEAVDG